jgi:hypothetical protein
MKRDCYCNLWEKNPKVLEDQGIPPGYYGICERCGKPGHLQHFPGPVAYTGAWCDHCVKIVPWTNPRVWLQLLLAGGFAVFIAWVLWKVR